MIRASEPFIVSLKGLLGESGTYNEYLSELVSSFTLYLNRIQTRIHFRLRLHDHLSFMSAQKNHPMTIRGQEVSTMTISLRSLKADDTRVLTHKLPASPPTDTRPGSTHPSAGTVIPSCTQASRPQTEGPQSTSKRAQTPQEEEFRKQMAIDASLARMKEEQSRITSGLNVGRRTGAGSSLVTKPDDTRTAW